LFRRLARVATEPVVSMLLDVGSRGCWCRGALGRTNRLDPPTRSLYVPLMPAANASPRGQRHAILASPLAELTGFALTVDCLGRGCAGERTYSVTALAACYGASMTVGDVLRLMRCARGCGGRPVVAWLVTGPVLNKRVRPRRVALLGAEARE